ncbi:hypothetical protein TrST_g13584 [Triparma strigata]|uniref:Uncharacterized protein n=1 Tax=Triparma strigata TaxID=1606541 RepID=A0A9W6ZZ23_9STRA|nr:hypothetical protein TrST_g13584 [Triparma strigata]
MLHRDLRRGVCLIWVFLIIVLSCVNTSYSFALLTPINSFRTTSALRSDRESPEELYAQAAALRAELSELSPISPIAPPSPPSSTHRLSVSIGREKNTWMSRRWSSSGVRIPFTLDCTFTPTSLLQSTPSARLRSGYDSLKTEPQSYEYNPKTSALKFSLNVLESYRFRDCEIYATPLLFAINAYGPRWYENVSSKPGTVCIEQWGWNTGFLRKEKRIVGTFYVEEIDERVRRRDGF